MPPVRLSQLLEGAQIHCVSEIANDPVIAEISSDTRTIGKETLFVCMPSGTRDTHELLAEAQSKGAVACVVHSSAGAERAKQLGLESVWIENKGQSFNAALGRICKEFYQDPTSKAKVIGVTGTNGKTTTAWMVRNALVAMGFKAAYLGTLGFQLDQDMLTLENTTPFPVEMWQLLQAAVDASCQYVVLEASSHALYQRRLAGVSFCVGAFTNLTQDHLDFHGSMEEYAESKKLLFTEYAMASERAFQACINIGDQAGAAWLKDLPCSVQTYGTEDSDLVVTGHDVRVDGLTIRAKDLGEARLLFGGDYNISNAATALSILVALGFDAISSLNALSQVKPVPGRFEPIPNDLGIGILVDYAHTPDALENLLLSVRGVTSGKLITVFGCGGDRDRTKRPKMAAVASKLSDICIVTSDNPRTENPDAIIDEVMLGIVSGATTERVTAREQAIERAIDLAKFGDVVVIAGKGHEDYQIIGREKIHMSDQEMARSSAQKKGASAQ